MATLRLNGMHTSRCDEPPAEMSNEAIAAEVARLLSIANEAEAPEDDLPESGYARLYALQDEQERRERSVEGLAR